jgi:hypothetical protein
MSILVTENNLIPQEVKVASYRAKDTINITKEAI